MSEKHENENMLHRKYIQNKIYTTLQKNQHK